MKTFPSIQHNFANSLFHTYTNLYRFSHIHTNIKLKAMLDTPQVNPSRRCEQNHSHSTYACASLSANQWKDGRLMYQIHIKLICAFVIIPTGKFYLIFYFREEKKWLLSLQMFVMIPCLKSACILFDLSLQHSHFFIQQNNPTYFMLYVSK